MYLLYIIIFPIIKVRRPCIDSPVRVSKCSKGGRPISFFFGKTVMPETACSSPTRCPEPLNNYSACSSYYFSAFMDVYA